MSTNAQCGYSGSTSIGTEVMEWTLTELQDTPDATSMDSGGYKESIACLQSAEGTFITQVVQGGPGARVGATFSNSIYVYDLDLIVTHVAIGTPVDGKVTYRHSWISTGVVHRT